MVAVAGGLMQSRKAFNRKGREGRKEERPGIDMVSDTFGLAT
jgi:hypothetical protein